MRKITVLASFVATLLCGCLVTSLQPIYTEKDLIFDEHLVGTWVPKDQATDAEGSWSFAKGEGNAYRLLINESKWPHSFDIRLIKLGNTLFLDFQISQEGLKEIEDDFSMYPAFLIPSHGIAKVSQIEPEFKLAWLNAKWVDDFLKRNPEALRHERTSDDRLILSASTADLQKFLLKHAGDKEAFDELHEMIRHDKEAEDKK